MQITAPVLVFKKVDERYYAANMLADKLSKFCEAKRIIYDHIEQLRDIGFKVDVE